MLGHRQAFTWIDEWHEMTLEDVRRYEAKLQKQTNSLLTNPDDGGGDGDNKSQKSGSVTPTSPKSPKSPEKKGYFSWF